MKRIPIIEVPLNVYEDLVEQKATEGARRNIAMAHIIRQRDLRPRLEEALALIEELQERVWQLEEGIS